LFYSDTRLIYDRDTGWVVSYTAMGDEEGGHYGVQVWADDKDLWERSSQNKPSLKEMLFKNCVPVNMFMTDQNLELLIKMSVLEQDLMEMPRSDEIVHESANSYQQAEIIDSTDDLSQVVGDELVRGGGGSQVREFGGGCQGRQVPADAGLGVDEEGEGRTRSTQLMGMISAESELEI
jgi:hypothetical protein